MLNLISFALQGASIHSTLISLTDAQIFSRAHPFSWFLPLKGIVPRVLRYIVVLRAVRTFFTL